MMSLKRSLLLSASAGVLCLTQPASAQDHSELAAELAEMRSAMADTLSSQAA